ncbi:unnamed protein product [Closterium sp. Naga37s-1]|nr:unnamed protein product [Closterium sp. Naga37s-1]
MSGYGTLTWANGDSYEGEWEAGLEHGAGTFKWADGSCFEGTWSRGLKDGKGLYFPKGYEEGEEEEEWVEEEGAGPSDKAAGEGLSIDTTAAGATAAGNSDKRPSTSSAIHTPRGGNKAIRPSSSAGVLSITPSGTGPKNFSRSVSVIGGGRAGALRDWKRKEALERQWAECELKLGKSESVPGPAPLHRGARGGRPWESCKERGGSVGSRWEETVGRIAEEAAEVAGMGTGERGEEEVGKGGAEGEAGSAGVSVAGVTEGGMAVENVVVGSESGDAVTDGSGATAAAAAAAAAAAGAAGAGGTAEAVIGAEQKTEGQVAGKEKGVKQGGDEATAAAPKLWRMWSKEKEKDRDTPQQQPSPQQQGEQGKKGRHWSLRSTKSSAAAKPSTPSLNLPHAASEGSLGAGASNSGTTRRSSVDSAGAGGTPSTTTAAGGGRQNKPSSKAAAAKLTRVFTMGPVPARENSGRVDSSVQSGAGGGLVGLVRGSSVGSANGEEGDEGRAGADGDRGGSTAADRHTSSSHESEAGADSALDSLHSAQESEAGADSALDSLRSSAMFSSGRTQRQRRRHSKVVTVREYVQGVMVAEIPRSKLQHDLVRRRGPTRRAGRKAGELIYKGHRSYDLMTAIQLGLRHSTGRATPPPVAPSAAPSPPPPIPAAPTPTTPPTAAPASAAPSPAVPAAPAAPVAPAAPSPAAPASADLRPEDFEAADRMWFPPEGSSCTPPHNTLPFTWRDYAPKAFSELRAMFGIDPADYTLSLSYSVQLTPSPNPSFFCSPSFPPSSELRAMFGIDPADYTLSLCGDNALRELSSPGKSGSVFYLSDDDRFIIKTMRASEVRVSGGVGGGADGGAEQEKGKSMRASLGVYSTCRTMIDSLSKPCAHLKCGCSRSLFPASPFLTATQNTTTNSPGASTTVNPPTATTTSSSTASATHPSVPTNQHQQHQQQHQDQHPDPHQQHNPQRYRRRRRLHTVLSSPSTLIRFVVMANVFVTDLRMHRRFDLKGSSQGRSTEKGCHAHTVLSSPSTLIRFVVMANVFVTDLRMHRRFDLKGSSQGRSTEKVAVDETTTLKDLDLDLSFHMPASWRALMHRCVHAPPRRPQGVVAGAQHREGASMHRRVDLKGSSQGRSTEKVAVDETTTLKDLDLDLSFHMPASWRALMHRCVHAPPRRPQGVVAGAQHREGASMHRRVDLKGSSQGRSTEKVAVDETTTLKDLDLDLSFHMPASWRALMHRCVHAPPRRPQGVVAGAQHREGASMHRRVDLKGSSQGRSTEKVAVDETTTLKDLDLDLSFHMPASWRALMHRCVHAPPRRPQGVVAGAQHREGASMHRRVDLKGSSQGRSTEKVAVDETTTLKDLDLDLSFHMPALWRALMHRCVHAPPRRPQGVVAGAQHREGASMHRRVDLKGSSQGRSTEKVAVDETTTLKDLDLDLSFHMPASWRALMHRCVHAPPRRPQGVVAGAQHREGASMHRRVDLKGSSQGRSTEKVAVDETTTLKDLDLDLSFHMPASWRALMHRCVHAPPRRPQGVVAGAQHREGASMHRRVDLKGSSQGRSTEKVAVDETTTLKDLDLDLSFHMPASWRALMHRCVHAPPRRPQGVVAGAQHREGASMHRRVDLKGSSQGRSTEKVAVDETTTLKDLDLDLSFHMPASWRALMHRCVHAPPRRPQGVVAGAQHREGASMHRRVDLKGSSQGRSTEKVAVDETTTLKDLDLDLSFHMPASWRALMHRCVHALPRRPQGVVAGAQHREGASMHRRVDLKGSSQGRSTEKVAVDETTTLKDLDLDLSFHMPASWRALMHRCVHAPPRRPQGVVAGAQHREGASMHRRVDLKGSSQGRSTEKVAVDETTTLKDLDLDLSFHMPASWRALMHRCVHAPPRRPQGVVAGAQHREGASMHRRVDLKGSSQGRSTEKVAVDETTTLKDLDLDLSFHMPASWRALMHRCVHAPPRRPQGVVAGAQHREGASMHRRVDLKGSSQGRSTEKVAVDETTTLKDLDLDLSFHMPASWRALMHRCVHAPPRRPQGVVAGAQHREGASMHRRVDLKGSSQGRSTEKVAVDETTTLKDLDLNLSFHMPASWRALMHRCVHAPPRRPQGVVAGAQHREGASMHRRVDLKGSSQGRSTEKVAVDETTTLKDLDLDLSFHMPASWRALMHRCVHAPPRRPQGVVAGAQHREGASMHRRVDLKGSSQGRSTEKVAVDETTTLKDLDLDLSFHMPASWRALMHRCVHAPPRRPQGVVAGAQHREGASMHRRVDLKGSSQGRSTEKVAVDETTTLKDLDLDLSFHMPASWRALMHRCVHAPPRRPQGVVAGAQHREGASMHRRVDLKGSSQGRSTEKVAVDETTTLKDLDLDLSFHMPASWRALMHRCVHAPPRRPQGVVAGAQHREGASMHRRVDLKGSSQGRSTEKVAVDETTTLKDLDLDLSFHMPASWRALMHRCVHAPPRRPQGVVAGAQHREGASMHRRVDLKGSSQGRSTEKVAVDETTTLKDLDLDLSFHMPASWRALMHRCVHAPPRRPQGVVAGAQHREGASMHRRVDLKGSSQGRSTEKVAVDETTTLKDLDLDLSFHMPASWRALMHRCVHAPPRRPQGVVAGAQHREGASMHRRVDLKGSSQGRSTEKVAVDETTTLKDLDLDLSFHMPASWRALMHRCVHAPPRRPQGVVAGAQHREGASMHRRVDLKGSSQGRSTEKVAVDETTTLKDLDLDLSFHMPASWRALMHRCVHAPPRRPQGVVAGAQHREGASMHRRVDLKGSSQGRSTEKVAVDETTTLKDLDLDLSFHMPASWRALMHRCVHAPPRRPQGVVAGAQHREGASMHRRVDLKGSSQGRSTEKVAVDETTTLKDLDLDLSFHMPASWRALMHRCVHAPPRRPQGVVAGAQHREGASMHRRVDLKGSSQGRSTEKVAVDETTTLKDLDLDLSFHMPASWRALMHRCVHAPPRRPQGVVAGAQHREGASMHRRVDLKGSSQGRSTEKVAVDETTTLKDLDLDLSFHMPASWRALMHRCVHAPPRRPQGVVAGAQHREGASMHRRVDLKGSSQGRSTEKVAVDETTTLKDLDLDLSFHMPASWRALMHSTEKVAVDETTTLKDLDLDLSFHMPASWRALMHRCVHAPPRRPQGVVAGAQHREGASMHRRVDLKGSSQGRSTEKVAVDETTTLKDLDLDLSFHMPASWRALMHRCVHAPPRRPQGVVAGAQHREGASMHRRVDLKGSSQGRSTEKVAVDETTTLKDLDLDLSFHMPASWRALMHRCVHAPPRRPQGVVAGAEHREGASMHRRVDLKGSSQGRSTEKVAVDETTTLKDLDLDLSFHMPASWRALMHRCVHAPPRRPQGVVAGAQHREGASMHRRVDLKGSSQGRSTEKVAVDETTTLKDLELDLSFHMPASWRALMHRCVHAPPRRPQGVVAGAQHREGASMHRRVDLKGSSQGRSTEKVAVDETTTLKDLDLDLSFHMPASWRALMHRCVHAPPRRPQGVVAGAQHREGASMHRRVDLKGSSQGRSTEKVAVDETTTLKDLDLDLSFHMPASWRALMHRCVHAPPRRPQGVVAGAQHREGASMHRRVDLKGSSQGRSTEKVAVDETTTLKDLDLDLSFHMPASWRALMHRCVHAPPRRPQGVVAGAQHREGASMHRRVDLKGSSQGRSTEKVAVDETTTLKDLDLDLSFHMPASWRALMHRCVHAPPRRPQGVVAGAQHREGASMHRRVDLKGSSQGRSTEKVAVDETTTLKDLDLDLSFHMPASWRALMHRCVHAPPRRPQGVVAGAQHREGASMHRRVDLKGSSQGRSTEKVAVDETTTLKDLDLDLSFHMPASWRALMHRCVHAPPRRPQGVVAGAQHREGASMHRRVDLKGSSQGRSTEKVAVDETTTLKDLDLDLSFHMPASWRALMHRCVHAPPRRPQGVVAGAQHREGASMHRRVDLKGSSQGRSTEKVAVDETTTLKDLDLDLSFHMPASWRALMHRCVHAPPRRPQGVVAGAQHREGASMHRRVDLKGSSQGRSTEKVAVDETTTLKDLDLDLSFHMPASWRALMHRCVHAPPRRPQGVVAGAQHREGASMHRRVDLKGSSQGRSTEKVAVDETTTLKDLDLDLSFHMPASWRALMHRCVHAPPRRPQGVVAGAQHREGASMHRRVDLKGSSQGRSTEKVAVDETTTLKDLDLDLSFHMPASWRALMHRCVHAPPRRPQGVVAGAQHREGASMHRRVDLKGSSQGRSTEKVAVDETTTLKDLDLDLSFHMPASWRALMHRCVHAPPRRPQGVVAGAQHREGASMHRRVDLKGSSQGRSTEKVAVDETTTLKDLDLDLSFHMPASWRALMHRCVHAPPRRPQGVVAGAQHREGASMHRRVDLKGSSQGRSTEKVAVDETTTLKDLDLDLSFHMPASWRALMHRCVHAPPRRPQGVVAGAQHREGASMHRRVDLKGSSQGRSTEKVAVDETTTLKDLDLDLSFHMPASWRALMHRCVHAPPRRPQGVVAGAQHREGASMHRRVDLKGSSQGRSTEKVAVDETTTLKDLDLDLSFHMPASWRALMHRCVHAPPRRPQGVVAGAQHREGASMHRRVDLKGSSQGRSTEKVAVDETTTLKDLDLDLSFHMPASWRALMHRCVHAPPRRPQGVVAGAQHREGASMHRRVDLKGSSQGRSTEKVAVDETTTLKDLDLDLSFHMPASWRALMHRCVHAPPRRPQGVVAGAQHREGASMHRRVDLKGSSQGRSTEKVAVDETTTLKDLDLDLSFHMPASWRALMHRCVHAPPRRPQGVVAGAQHREGASMHRRVDLKGSSQGRSTEKVAVDETTTLKDLDLDPSFHMPASWRALMHRCVHAPPRRPQGVVAGAQHREGASMHRRVDLKGSSQGRSTEKVAVDETTTLKDLDLDLSFHMPASWRALMHRCVHAPPRRPQGVVAGAQHREGASMHRRVDLKGSSQGRSTEKVAVDETTTLKDLDLDLSFHMPASWRALMHRCVHAPPRRPQGVVAGAQHREGASMHRRVDLKGSSQGRSTEKVAVDETTTLKDLDLDLSFHMPASWRALMHRCVHAPPRRPQGVVAGAQHREGASMHRRVDLKGSSQGRSTEKVAVDETTTLKDLDLDLSFHMPASWRALMHRCVHAPPRRPQGVVAGAQHREGASMHRRVDLKGSSQGRSTEKVAVDETTTLKDLDLDLSFHMPASWRALMHRCVHAPPRRPQGVVAGAQHREGASMHRRVDLKGSSQGRSTEKVAVDETTTLKDLDLDPSFHMPASWRALMHRCVHAPPRRPQGVVAGAQHREGASMHRRVDLKGSSQGRSTEKVAVDETTTLKDLDLDLSFHMPASWRALMHRCVHAPPRRPQGVVAGAQHREGASMHRRVDLKGSSQGRSTEKVAVDETTTLKDLDLDLSFHMPASWRALMHRCVHAPPRRPQGVVAGAQHREGASMHRRVDLKGSLQGRSTEKVAVDETTTLKDLDLDLSFHMPASWRALMHRCVHAPPRRPQGVVAGAQHREGASMHRRVDLKGSSQGRSTEKVAVDETTTLKDLDLDLSFHMPASWRALMHRCVHAPPRRPQGVVAGAQHREGASMHRRVDLKGSSQGRSTEKVAVDETTTLKDLDLDLSFHMPASWRALMHRCVHAPPRRPQGVVAGAQHREGASMHRRVDLKGSSQGRSTEKVAVDETTTLKDIDLDLSFHMPASWRALMHRCVHAPPRRPQGVVAGAQHREGASMHRRVDLKGSSQGRSTEKVAVDETTTLKDLDLDLSFHMPASWRALMHRCVHAPPRRPQGVVAGAQHREGASMHRRVDLKGSSQGRSTEKVAVDETTTLKDLDLDLSFHMPASWRALMHRCVHAPPRRPQGVVAGAQHREGASMHRRVDLKGSSQGRSTENVAVDETTTLKDLDLDLSFHMPASWRALMHRCVHAPPRRPQGVVAGAQHREGASMHRRVDLKGSSQGRSTEKVAVDETTTLKDLDLDLSFHMPASWRALMHRCVHAPPRRPQGVVAGAQHREGASMHRRVDLKGSSQGRSTEKVAVDETTTLKDLDLDLSFHMPASWRALMHRCVHAPPRRPQGVVAGAQHREGASMHRRVDLKGSSQGRSTEKVAVDETTTLKDLDLDLSFHMPASWRALMHRCVHAPPRRPQGVVAGAQHREGASMHRRVDLKGSSQGRSTEKVAVDETTTLKDLDLDLSFHMPASWRALMHRCVHAPPRRPQGVVAGAQHREGASMHRRVDLKGSSQGRSTEKVAVDETTTLKDLDLDLSFHMPASWRALMHRCVHAPPRRPQGVVAGAQHREGASMHRRVDLKGSSQGRSTEKVAVDETTTLKDLDLDLSFHMPASWRALMHRCVHAPPRRPQGVVAGAQHREGASMHRRVDLKGSSQGRSTEKVAVDETTTLKDLDLDLSFHMPASWRALMHRCVHAPPRRPQGVVAGAQHREGASMHRRVDLKGSSQGRSTEKVAVDETTTLKDLDLDLSFHMPASWRALMHRCVHAPPRRPQGVVAGAQHREGASMHRRVDLKGSSQGRSTEKVAVDETTTLKDLDLDLSFHMPASWRALMHRCVHAPPRRPQGVVAGAQHREGASMHRRVDLKGSSQGRSTEKVAVDETTTLKDLDLDLSFHMPASWRALMHRCVHAPPRRPQGVVAGAQHREGASMHRRVDLKGSSQGRSTEKVAVDETTTLKDLDLDLSFHMPASWRALMHRCVHAPPRRPQGVVAGAQHREGASMHRRVDLKGSSQGRSTEKVAVDETTTLKDLDLDLSFHMPASWRALMHRCVHAPPRRPQGVVAGAQHREGASMHRRVDLKGSSQGRSTEKVAMDETTTLKDLDLDLSFHMPASWRALMHRCVHAPPRRPQGVVAGAQHREGASMHRRVDLKGSSQGRSTEKVAVDETTTLKDLDLDPSFHMPASWRALMHSTEKVAVDETTTLKDLDLSFHMPASWRALMHRWAGLGECKSVRMRPCTASQPHSLSSPSTLTRFVVMANVFDTDLRMHRRQIALDTAFLRAAHYGLEPAAGGACTMHVRTPPIQFPHSPLLFASRQANRTGHGVPAEAAHYGLQPAAGAAAATEVEAGEDQSGGDTSAVDDTSAGEAALSATSTSFPNSFRQSPFKPPPSLPPAPCL